jgi:hypothetical protein
VLPRIESEEQLTEVEAAKTNGHDEPARAVRRSRTIPTITRPPAYFFVYTNFVSPSPIGPEKCPCTLSVFPSGLSVYLLTKVVGSS